MNAKTFSRPQPIRPMAAFCAPRSPAEAAKAFVAQAHRIVNEIEGAMIATIDPKQAEEIPLLLLRCAEALAKSAKGPATLTPGAKLDRAQFARKLVKRGVDISFFQK